MTTTTNVEIKRLNQVEIVLRMVGTTPLYFNSMSAKTKRDLLLGGGKKTAKEPRSSLNKRTARLDMRAIQALGAR